MKLQWGRRTQPSKRNLNELVSFSWFLIPLQKSVNFFSNFIIIYNSKTKFEYIDISDW